MKNNFQKQLIKGKIAELIFQQMFAEAKQYTILPLGYERVLPGLLDYSSNNILKPIRSAPDFVLVPKDEKDENIMIVEVKFRKHPETSNNLLKIAKEQNKRWNPSYLFIASLKGFYFGRCDLIIKNRKIEKLSEELIPKKYQDRYCKMVSDFLKEQ
ncbi:hypothetical protein C0583_04535 [Candidatus Parcubacteria bacterium]|nr:MAG: hypothetical protein C0583_04535 [Candidatus Parcubacteria bacterium]